ncbi:xanthine dehydrogenase family protein molybdopterin-binding subunit [Microvirga sp. SRT01]|uniref:Xanthine dehydrogenase family protein molybdopterin-binding subunit n=1 Tax=Sphingomonas longa TaxID=2778730 RepID=A0ABS2DAL1_9SPHN|nr:MULTISPECIES: molybdopterin cofactor-binding domain-containing protein [Alphaproteobacteria]MBM6577972.1 xanthine dehydrogenase family protein molybdopterin-binding subunit [Sphingomonas sp. BT552]MBR7711013.1 xanthine dehydrogenase family protein molybdopterin-binding subunit [Microvirga sp. SRT01]
MPIDRRQLLVAGGIGTGLIVAWNLWPRDYPPTLVASAGETPFGAYLKIGEDGHITVAVPQAEHGQGIWTTLPQIVADELGADWRTVAVEAAPLSPLYANALGLDDLLEGMPTGVTAANPAPMLTAASSAIRRFEDPARDAAATARALLCMAAARRWDADWRACSTAAGFVVLGRQRLRFAELAAAAAKLTPPDPLPIGVQGAGKLMGQDLPRLDAPAKVDGSVNFAGDIRLPDMVHAAIRQGPLGDSRLVKVDRAAADRVRGVLSVVETQRWVATVATTWWAASQGLEALGARFETHGPRIDDASIARALDTALDGNGHRLAATGDLSAVFRGAVLFTATYRAAAGVHAAIETPAATAHYDNGRLEMWLPTQAPGVARAAAARAAGLAEEAVLVHPMQIGGSVGQGLDTQCAEQAAVLAVKIGRPVSLTWSRGEAMLHDEYRPPAVARMAARLGAGGAILGWQAKIAAPPTGVELARRLVPGLGTRIAQATNGADAYAVGGALPPYRLPVVAIDHHPAHIGIPTGHFRGGAHGLTCFFTECFLDELAHAGRSEPVSFRIGMLGGEPRLARCLSTAASLGGWEGGVQGSGQGIAAHAFRGSYVAVMAEAHRGDDGRPVVDRLVAAVDCGRMVNPDIVRQQVEGGLIVGLAQALGGATGFDRNLATARGFDGFWLPRLADTPDITVELIRSGEAPGGVSELAIPPVAPAIANALHAATGYRIRRLPLRA